MRFRIRWRGPSLTVEWANNDPETYEEEEIEQADNNPIGGGSGHNFERSWDETPEDRVSGFGFTP